MPGMHMNRHQNPRDRKPRAPHRLLCAAVLAGVLLSAAHAQESARAAGNGGSWSARVGYVVDGDSIWVLPAGGGARVRLRIDGIDAPEICQAGGAPARAALLALVRGEPLRVSVRAHDRYGRAIASVRRERDGLDVAARMVQDGWAWSDSNGWRRGRYGREEDAARASRSGVFAASAPERPADFRRRHGACPHGPSPATTGAAPAGLSRPWRLQYLETFGTRLT